MPRNAKPAATDEWTTVVEESSAVIIMDTPGDQFTGLYVGEEHVEPPEGEPFDRFLFRGDDGTLYSMNRGHKLAQGLREAKPGETRVRITLVKEIDLGKEGQNPMKDYKIEFAR